MLVEAQDRKVVSTLAGEQVTMGIRPEDMAHIMGVLSGLYSDKLLAMIREYSTNAWDAHVEAGVSLPIEVSTPSPFAPILKVRDYGLGLDIEDIRSIYSQYGRSTKRETNGQVGMLGLGSKSALTYTNQFTVTSVKNGVRTVVLVARKEDGAGTMTILGQTPTDDASGTEVAIDIKRDDVQPAQEKAVRFFSYWTPGSVIVNGAAPAHFSENALKLDDETYLVEASNSASRWDSSRNVHHVVMGNVRYPITLPQIQNLGWNSVVALVPIGTVRPVPSREALVDGTGTEKAAAEIAARIPGKILAAVQRDVDTATSHADALRIAIDGKQKYGVDLSLLTYRGTALPTEYTDTGRTNGVKYAEGRNVNLSTGGRYSYGNVAYGVERWNDTTWITGFTPEKFSGPQRNKVWIWEDEQGLARSKRVVLCADNGPQTPFVDKARVIDWQTIKKIKLPKSGGANTRLSGSYDALTEDGFAYEVAAEDIRDGEPLFYSGHNQAGLYKDLVSDLDKYTIVQMPDTRVAKFLRMFPKAKPIAGEAQGAYDRWHAKQNTNLLKALVVRRHWSKLPRSFDPSKVDDPEIKRLAAYLKVDVRTVSSEHRAFAKYHTIDAKLVDNPLDEALLDKYPLADLQSHWTTCDDHLYAYMNAVHNGLI